MIARFPTIRRTIPTKRVEDEGGQDVLIHHRRVRYWEFHPEQPRVIIFLHGFRGNHRGLVPVAKLLSDFRVIIPDLPGYGHSEPLEGIHDFSHYAEFVARFAETLQLKQYIVAGHSYGASLALVIGAHPPSAVEQIILVEPVISATNVTARLGQAYYALGARMPQTLRRWWIKNAALNRLSTELLTTVRDPQQKKVLVRNEQANMDFVIEQVEIESYLGYYAIDFQDLARQVTVPTIFFAGQRDQLTPLRVSRALAATMPQTSLIVLPKAGHFIPMEQPEQLAEAIRSAVVSH